MLDEPRIEGDPVLPGDDAREGELGRLGGLRADDPEPVRDAVDVGVDRDRRDPVAEDEDAVRRLRADRREGDEVVVPPRHLAVEPIEELPGAGADGPRLHPVEARRADQRLDRGRGRGRERRGVREAGEQEGGRPVGVRVLRPLREDRSDQDLERVRGVVPEVRGPPVPGPVQRREAVEHRLPGEGDGAPARHVGPRTRGGGAAVPGSERSGSSAPSPAARLSSPTR